jgi:hypothetical protein
MTNLKEFRRSLTTLFACALILSVSAAALAVDIPGVREASLDQPRMNFVIEPAGGGNPYDYENFLGDKSINIFGYLDTGASGIVISDASAQSLALPRSLGVEFFDVGVGGASIFDVSQPVRVRAAASNSTAIDNVNNYQSVYNQSTGSVRLQVGPTNTSPDPLADPLDVFGMPIMMGKTVVMDPKPTNELDLMNTYLYNQGTPFNPAAATTNPGIPTTSHHVKLSYGDFGRFTETTPTGAAGPNINHNPFLGPNPVLQLDDNPPADNTPPVNISYNALQTSGSFLLDTGAAVSFISNSLAASLHVRYAAGNGADPVLEVFDPNNPAAPGTAILNQFQVPIQGIGGVVTLSGFFLDSMLLHTMEGSLDPNDPNNIRYLGAPVVVHDVTVVDPLTDQELTLDGVFGTNFLVASIALDLGDARESPYQWITFDEPNGILGLDLGITVPEPSTYVMAGTGLFILMGCAWRKRRQGRG